MGPRGDRDYNRLDPPHCREDGCARQLRRLRRRRRRSLPLRRRRSGQRRATVQHLWWSRSAVTLPGCARPRATARQVPLVHLMIGLHSAQSERKDARGHQRRVPGRGQRPPFRSFSKRFQPRQSHPPGLGHPSGSRGSFGPASLKRLGARSAEDGEWELHETFCFAPAQTLASPSTVRWSSARRRLHHRAGVHRPCPQGQSSPLWPQWVEHDA